MKLITPILSAIGMAVILGSLGQALDQWDKDTATAREAQKAARQESRFEKAARAICGENAGFRMTNIPGEIQCMTKRGLVRATKGMS